MDCLPNRFRAVPALQGLGCRLDCRSGLPFTAFTKQLVLKGKEERERSTLGVGVSGRQVCCVTVSIKLI
ncbi:hypothetical protein ACRRTK_003516 [Alexandromys fortis]